MKLLVKYHVSFHSLLALVSHFLLALVLLLCMQSCGSSDIHSDAAEWPPVSRECKPWTYWWWMGSAVDSLNLTHNLEEYAAAGLGGVHVIPIYGAKGYENNFIPYLSQKWVGMFGHAATEAVRLGMGIDMTTGTGWPFGGPQVTPSDAAKRVRFETFNCSGGERFTRTFPTDSLRALVAHYDRSKTKDIYKLIDRKTGYIDWTAPVEKCTIYAVYQEGTGQQVKRAAPGAKGNVLNFFSQNALDRYLEKFDKSFDSYGKSLPIRAFYNDSYEVYGSNWTDNLFDDFIRLRDYDLRKFLPELIGNSDSDLAARVRHDYNETISDLLLEQFSRPWVNWAHSRGSFTRSQSHGSPGNLLDLYGSADIPETEAFGTSGFPIPGLRIDPDMPEHFGKPDLLVAKFASSAAHVTGKKLVSSESCTWLGEHFKVGLSQVKPEIDALFVAGVNHVFFHGMAYSPKEASWPGWLFYAATNFAQSNPFWRDMPELTAYITRTQSFLQTGLPANDVLLYWPVHDRWREVADDDMLHHFQVHNANEWLYGTPFHDAAKTMWDRGYAFDYISDTMFAELKAESGKIITKGATYKTIVVPGCRYMPLETMENLVRLAGEGADIIVIGDMPADVPGLTSLGMSRSRLKALVDDAQDGADERKGYRINKVGKGSFMIGDNLETMLNDTKIAREPVVDYGIEFIRRTHYSGHHYFLTNLSGQTFNGTVRLAVRAHSAVLFDPLTGETGYAEISGKASSPKVRLQLEPGQSCILRTLAVEPSSEPSWRYLSTTEESYDLTGTWSVEFIDGGPIIPAGYSIDRLASWTELDDSDARAFSGTTRYSIRFTKPQSEADMWVLDLGKVCESARVSLNGNYAGTAWCHPFTLRLENVLKEGENLLEIEVTNLGANRIADLDRRGIPWKSFYDINYVNIAYEPFDASGWKPVDSGLIGPVKLLPSSAINN
ncbi:glycosyl hydrolase [Candidatus Latescibacterota bacterium]